MRKNQINGIMNDILRLGEDFNPLTSVCVKKKLVVDLLTGKISYGEEDDFSKFYIEKYIWFLNRVKELDGNLGDFKIATIYVTGTIETIKINYKNNSFEKKRDYTGSIIATEKIKEDIRKLKPSANVRR